MKKEYIDYAKRLNTIGDLIIAISNLIGKGLENDDLAVAIERYEYACDSLCEVRCPEVIESQHNKLTVALNEWIDVTKKAKNSTDVLETQQALKSQKEKEILIGKITEEITEIFLKN